MKSNLHSPSLSALSCFQSPSRKNEGSDQTSVVPSASSPANAMPDKAGSSTPAVPGKHRPGWLQKTHKKCFAIAKPVPQWEPAFLLVDPDRGSELLCQLRLHKADVAKGGLGSISIFKNQKGEKLVGKFISTEEICSAKSAIKIKESFEQEFKAVEKIYKTENVGRHPNLVNMYGIANVPDKTGALKRAILMEHVPGPHGMETFNALRKCWDSHKISTTEYWGAIQFLGRRLLDVTEHIAKAGVVHNDIKPHNFLVNENTGEPVLIDLGSWSEPESVIERGYTWNYSAPELRLAQEVSAKSDVFSVGASLLHGVEGGEIKEMEDAPNQGLRYVGPPLPDRHVVEENEDDLVYSSSSPTPSDEIRPYQDVDDEQNDPIDLLNIGELLMRSLRGSGTQNIPDQDDPQEIGPLKDNEGNLERNRRTYSAKTAYSDFMEQVMQVDESARYDARKAKNHPFLRESLLEDDAAKDVIQKAIRLAKIERKKPPEKQWKQPESQHKAYGRLYKQARKEIKELKGESPNLHTYASLQTYPKLRKHLDKNALRDLDQKIEEAVAIKANLYTELAEWFAHAKNVLEGVPTVLDGKPAARVKSGVDRKGIRIQTESESTDPRYTSAMAKARMILAPHVDTEALKRDVNDMERFLYEVKISKIDHPEITEKIKQIREQATIARRVLELFGQSFFSSEADSRLDKDTAKQAMEKAVLLAKSKMEKKNPWNRLKTVLMNSNHKSLKI